MVKGNLMKNSLFNKWCWNMQSKKEPINMSYMFINVNSEWLIDIKIKSKSIKTLNKENLLMLGYTIS